MAKTITKSITKSKAKTSAKAATTKATSQQAKDLAGLNQSNNENNSNGPKTPDNTANHNVINDDVINDDVINDNVEDTVVITEQTFVDLGMWLSEYTEPTAEQIKRLQLEQFYLALIQLANAYWLIGPLTNQLKEKAVFTALPQQLQDYLAEVESFCLQRSTMIKTEALFACDILQQHKIQHVMLKGAATLFNGVANPISIRFMTDIDVLVPENKQQQAVSIFKQAGFKVKEDEFALHGVNHHHAPALARDGVPCSVELHRWALKKTAAEVLSTSEIWNEVIHLDLNEVHSELGNEREFSAKQLSPTHQIILSIAHCEISHGAYADNQLDLHQLHNLYLLCKLHKNAINWQQVQQHFAKAKQQAVLYASLYSCLRLFNLTTPLVLTLSQAQKQQVQSHFEGCLNLYCDSQGKTSAFKYLSDILKGYTRQNIILIYGKIGLFPVFKGRVKHLYRHIKMIFTPKLLKRFLNKVFD